MTMQYSERQLRRMKLFRKRVEDLADKGFAEHPDQTAAAVNKQIEEEEREK